jgi:cyclophilin family peptidyl-prolyl cis-trans isomerase
MLAGSGIGITGAASTVVRDNLTKNVVLISNDKGKIAPSSLSINQLQGVITGGATTITDYDLTPNKVVISDADGKIGTSSVSNIEVGYLFGTNDSIQNQLDGKQNNLSNAAGTGEVLLESDSLKRIYGVSPINIETFNASLEVSIDESALGNITCNTLISNFDIQCGDLQAQSIYGGAAIQIQQNIDNAIAAAALTAQSPLSISNENLLSIDLSSIQSQIDGKANQATTYTKTEVDSSLALKADQSTTYTKTEVDNGLALKANQATTYTKTEVDNSLALKANQLTTYTKTEVNDRLSLKANQSTTYTKTEVDDKLVLKANQSTTYTKTEIDNNLLLKADQLTTYTKTEVDNGLFLKADKSTTYTKTEVDTQFANLIDTAPDALNTLNELAAALNDDANYAATVENQLASKQNVLSNVPGTGQILLESDYLKRIFAVSPLSVNTYLNLDDPDDPKNANIELSINESAFNQITCNTLVSNFDIQCGDLTAQSLYGGAALQIQQNIDNAIAAAALTAQAPLSISNENVLSIDLSTIQTQIDGKQDKVANVSDTEIGYLSNVTSDIQAQLNQREPLYTTISPIVKNLNLTTGDIELKLDSTVSTTDLNNIIGTTSGVQSQLNAKQNILATGNPSDPDHVKILENGKIPAIMLYPPSAANAGITLDTAMNPGAITIDYSVLQGTVAQRAWMSQVMALEEVVENPGNGYYYLRTPANSSLIVSNGDNTGSVAAFNFDGSSVLHGNVTILGNIKNTALTSQLNAKQNILSTGNPNDPSHVKLIEDNSIKAIIATNGLTATNQGSYVELSGAALESSIAAKQDLLSTGNPNDPSHVKLLEGNAVKAIIATGGLTVTDRFSYVELSGATLENTLTNKADQATTYTKTEVDNFLDSKVSYIFDSATQRESIQTDLISPLTSTTHVLVGGDMAVGGNCSIAQDLIVNGVLIDDSLALKQDKVANVSNTEIGYLSNVTSDIQAQLDQREPLYKTISPIVKNLNLTTGDIELKLDSTVSTTDLNNIIGTTSGVQSQLNGKVSQYTLPVNHDRWVKLGTLATQQGGYTTTLSLNLAAGHNASDSQTRFVNLQFTTSNANSSQPAANGQPFYAQCTGDGVFGEIRILQVSQSQYEFYYHSPLYSGFGVMEIRTNDTYTHEVAHVSEPTGTYINPTIKYAISSQLATFNTPVTCQYDLQCGDLTANAIYGGAAVQIQNQINAAITSPFWVAGKVDGVTLEILADKGRVGFSVARATPQSAGQYDIMFDQPHPNGAHYVIQLSAQEASDDFIRTGSYEPTANGLQVGIKAGVFVDKQFHILVLA